MKRFTFIILSVLFSVMSFAEDINPAQALAIAKSFLDGSSGQTRSPVMSSRQLKLAHTAIASDGKNGLYVFNVGNNGGFVIVAADDGAHEILGYSDSGSFDTNSISPEFKSWIAGYADEIAYIRRTGYRGAETVQAAPRKAVAPLLGDIMWNQDEPYNDMCPSYDLNARCATGCVATAMAQVMYYHRWPETGVGSHTYSPSILGGGTLTADFGNTRYAWDDMLPTYDATSSEASREAVALLMLHCGISVDMEYSTSSGAGSAEVAIALATYFNYDKGVAYRQRTNYGSLEWDNAIKNEIDAGRPVIATGRSSAGGHAFVFDGYDDNGLIHVNWGWSGMSNGYFRTTALMPPVQGVGGADGGYNYDQQIITGIQKPQEGSEPDIELVSSEGLVPAEETIANGASTDFRLCGMLRNAGWQDSEFDYGLMLTDADGNITKVVETGVSDVLYVGYMIFGPDFNDVSLGTLAPGEYTLYPVCRVKGGSGAWNRIRDEYVGYPNYIYLTATESEITFSYPEYFDLDIAELQLPEEVYAGVPAQIGGTVTNNGDVDYLGDIHVSIVDKDTKRSVATGSAYKIDLAPGASLDLELIDSYTLEPGNYLVTVVDDDNKRIAPLSEITVNEAPAEAAVFGPAEQLSFADNNNVDKNNMDITAKITCTSGVYGGYIYLYLFNETGTVQEGCLTPQYLFIKEGQTVDVTFGGAFENGVPGTVYTACLMTYDGNVLSFLSPMELSVCQFRLSDITSSIDNIETADEAPTAIYDISGKLLPTTDINSLPKGIYIVKRGGKTMKIVK